MGNGNLNAVTGNNHPITMEQEVNNNGTFWNTWQVNNSQQQTRTTFSKSMQESTRISKQRVIGSPNRPRTTRSPSEYPRSPACNVNDGSLNVSSSTRNQRTTNNNNKWYWSPIAAIVWQIIKYQSIRPVASITPIRPASLRQVAAGCAIGTTQLIARIIILVSRHVIGYAIAGQPAGKYQYGIRHTSRRIRRQN